MSATHAHPVFDCLQYTNTDTLSNQKYCDQNPEPCRKGLGTRLEGPGNKTGRAWERDWKGLGMRQEGPGNETGRAWE